MAVAVEVPCFGFDAHLQGQFAQGQGFGPRPRVHGVVVAQLPLHADATSAGLNEVLAVSNDLFRGFQWPPNLPLFLFEVR